MTVIENRDDNQELAKKKLIQIYKYLEALDQLRNPVKKQISDQLLTLWFKDLPQHTDINSDFLSENEISERRDEHTSESYLVVKKPELTSCPVLPVELGGWIKPGWNKIENEPEIIESIDLNQEDQSVELFLENEDRIAAYEQWLVEREQWRIAELPARKTMKVFEKLYSLYSWIERENDQVELILGEGILNWQMNKGTSIHHPILIQKVRLLFDPNVPEFTLAPTEQTIEFHSALFRDVQEVSALSINKCTDDIQEIQCLPLGYSETDDYLKRVISNLSAHGQFIAYGESVDQITLEQKAPFIQRNPVLYLRKRSMGFTNAIEGIIDSLNGTTTIVSEAVTRITGIEIGHEKNANHINFDSLDVNGENEDILFTKDANSEQLDIALKINKYGSVLVQGPPGTGKTHTIANLLGHFLAEGKSVLVTSHTSKALNVLRDKVAEPLQNLCVSVLDEISGRGQLESSIDMITEKLNSINSKQIEEEIRSLTKRRNDLLTSIRKINNDLRHSRENDYRSIIYLGQEFSPSQAARLVLSGQKQLFIIPGEIALGMEFPFDQEELEFLYSSMNMISGNDELEFQRLELHPQNLKTSTEFDAMVQEHRHLLHTPRDIHDQYWIEQENVPISELQVALQQTVDMVAVISTEHSWLLEVISAGKSGGIRSKDWEELISEISELMELYFSAKSAKYKFGPTIENGVELELLSEVLMEIIGYLRAGNSISKLQLLLKPKWRSVISSVKVNDQPPKEIQHFEAILVFIEHQKKRQQLFSRWKRQVTAIGGYDLETLGNEPEEYLEKINQEIIQGLSWFHEHWSKQIRLLIQFGLQWETLLQSKKVELGKHSEFYNLKAIAENELVHIVDSYINMCKFNQILHELDELDQIIKPYVASESTLVQSLNAAVLERNSDLYEDSYEALKVLWEKNEMLRHRSKLLNKLEEYAPSWAQAIRDREGMHGECNVPHDIHQAWLLKQFEGELSRRDALSHKALQNELTDLRRQFKIITTQLVEKKAWLALFRKTILKQQNALQGWKLLMKKAGKGTGIRAPHLLAEARSLMKECQTAVPVWIMPIHRVVDSFNPTQNQFDVVIIDEASQADVMALTAIYLGKQVVVVGDDEQVSPEAIGQKHDEVQKLIDMHLTGIPNAALYDGQTSIYDLAKTSFAGMTQLREHFRCVEPIIQFSNHLSYQGKILPLRDESSVMTRPFTVEYRVEGFLSGTKKNDVEARTIASLILASIEQEAYKDATFGVITLLGEEQALLVDQYLHKYLPETEYKKRNIRCGNSAQFQGDERDVIFLSMVHASEGDGPMRMLADTGDRMKKRYNVAVSRARNQLWLVHSIDSSTQLKDGDLRKRIINHVRNPYAVEEMLKQAEPKIQSEFERLVIERLFQEGYKVIPQWKVGAYSIDMVVEGGGKRLAVECDGDKWHPIEKIGEDMSRQSILERLGWNFIRIRGGEFFRDVDKALIPLFSKLNEMGITRELHLMDSSNLAFGDSADDLKNTVIIRAAQIRQKWNEQQEEYADVIRKKREVSKPETAIVSKHETKNEIKQVIVPSDVYQQTTLFDEEPLITGSKQMELSLDHNADSSESFDLLEYLERNNLSLIDKRDKGGALWVVGDKKLSPHLNECKKNGIEFIYLPGGSQASRKKPAWYTTYRE